LIIQLISRIVFSALEIKKRRSIITHTMMCV
jgi:hypothetical protein